MAKEVALKELREPFEAHEIEWRIMQAGKNDKGCWAKVCAYVTNRAIMDRLDKTVGPNNWQNEYREWRDKSQLCGLSLRVGEEWITKWDGAPDTEIESVKGGLSDSMKRAAVHWGIGRYLYDLEENWAKISPSGAHYAKTKEGAPFRWDAPDLPDWALPEKTPDSEPQKPRGKKNDTPQPGKAAGERAAMWQTIEACESAKAGSDLYYALEHSFSGDVLVELQDKCRDKVYDLTVAGITKYAAEGNSEVIAKTEKFVGKFDFTDEQREQLREYIKAKREEMNEPCGDPRRSQDVPY